MIGGHETASILVGGVFCAAIKIGDRKPRRGAVTPTGDPFRVLVGNIMSRIEDRIWITGSLSGTVAANAIKSDVLDELITGESGTQTPAPLKSGMFLQ